MSQSVAEACQREPHPLRKAVAVFLPWVVNGVSAPLMKRSHWFASDGGGMVYCGEEKYERGLTRLQGNASAPSRHLLHRKSR